MTNKYYQLAIKTLDLIFLTVEMGEDWSLLMNQYNGLIESHGLDLKKIRWINLTEYAFFE